LVFSAADFSKGTLGSYEHETTVDEKAHTQIPFSTAFNDSSVDLNNHRPAELAMVVVPGLRQDMSDWTRMASFSI